MDVVVSTEARFRITPDQRVWSQVGYGQEFWRRYLEVFDRVFVLARAKLIDRRPRDWLEVTGERVHLHPIPDYMGPAEYFLRLRIVHRAIRMALPADCAVIMRVPSQIGNCIGSMLVSRPFGLEVVGDPADVFTHEAIRDRLAFAYRWWFTRSLRRQCLRASGVAYVTRHALQQRYPSRALSLGLSDVDLPETALSGGPKVYTTYFSSIELKETHLAEHPRTKPTAATKIVTVGSLAQLYKGTDLLIDAVAGCRRRGVNLQLTIVGDGKYRPELEARVRRLDLAEHVFFAGQVTSGDPVRQLLDGSDVFVLPSRCEGLPRAMLEAMGRGLPCIGSAVGGIPELLAPEDIVPPGNVAALIQKISEVANNPTRLRAMSERNLRTAMDYRESVLAERRRRFYRHIRTQTEAWLQESP